MLDVGELHLQVSQRQLSLRLMDVTSAIVHLHDDILGARWLCSSKSFLEDSHDGFSSVASGTTGCTICLSKRHQAHAELQEDTPIIPCANMHDHRQHGGALTAVGA